MKIEKSKIALIAILAAFIIFALTLAVIINFDRIRPKIRVGYYNLTEKQIESIKGQLEECKNPKGKKIWFSYTEIKNTNDKKIKKLHILISPMGRFTNEITDKFCNKKSSKFGLDTNILKGASMGAAQKAVFSSTKTPKILQLPLLFDPYEVLMSKTAIDSTGNNQFYTWEDFNTFLNDAKSTCSVPFAFMGAEADSALGFVSSIAESYLSINDYYSMTEIIKSTPKEKYPELIAELCEKKDSPLHETAELLRLFEKENFINNNTYEMHIKNILTLMESNSSAIVLNLSEHRNIPVSTVKNYSSLPLLSGEHSMYFPSSKNITERGIVARTICAVPLTANKKAKLALTYLTTRTVQGQLSHHTGLAPLLANSSVPDVQADDARYWIAASKGAVTPISDACFIDDDEKNSFLQAFRNYISKK